MTNKIVLLGIAILALGLVALPETLALFAGQHDWYAIDQGSTTGNYGVPCAKCHADVQSQITNMEVGGAHTAGTTCEQCHIVSALRQGETVGGDGSIHAATAPACMDCHDGTVPGGTYTGAPPANSIKDGAKEAHKDFITSAEANPLMEGANEACVACHTHVAVNIVWNKPTDLSFESRSNNIGVWTVSNFQSGGSTTTTTNG